MIDGRRPSAAGRWLAALAAGALDGFTGFLVQVGLLGGLLLLTPASLELNLDLGLAGAKRTLLL
ncbi:MAG: hypothetical protein N2688_09300, partial [Burkholderiaceae bacterium]|nr:hypothetical protein [Burkholderiaceae bacterium]